MNRHVGQLAAGAFCILSVLGGSAATAQSPATAQQFNRINGVMTVAEVYTAAAAANLGGASNLMVDMENAVAGANVVMQNSGTGLYVDCLGYYEVSETDPNSLHTALSDLNGVWTDADNFQASTGAGILQCVVDGTDDAGLSYECWEYGTVSSVYGAWYVVYSHELGRNCCLEQGDDVGNGAWDCIMLFNYCTAGNSPIAYCSNPSVYYEGYQLLGTTNIDCGEGPLANEGNNARQFALVGPGYWGSAAVPLSSLGIYNPILTAVHCGGAAVATQSPDQRTFAADQSYSGGGAWDNNGYNYTIDVSGVTNPAPQTLYQDQRYGNTTYTFTNYLPGTNYLVRLHCVECCWWATGQREFNVFINGVKVLTNFDILAAAGAQNRAVIREFMTTADANGRVAVQFANAVDNASISGIEILQGGLYTPINLTAAALNSQISLGWSPVAGVTGYNVKRSATTGGPYTTITNVAATMFNDTNIATGVTYYYVVSAVNGGNESFNSLEASAASSSTTVNTWTGSGGISWGTAGSWSSGVPSGADAYINTTNGNICTLIATPSTYPVDIIVGSGGGFAGRVDQRGGYVQTASTNATGNWLFIGRGSPAASGVYNLANTLTIVGGLTGFGEGSGSVAAGKILVGGGFYSDNGNGIMRVNTTGSVTTHSSQYYAASMAIGQGPEGVGEIDLQNGTVLSGSSLWVGGSDGIGAYAGSGTFKISGGTLLVDNDNTGNPSYLGYLNGAGTMIVSNGTLSFGDELRVGGSDTSGPEYNATGALVMYGGSAAVGALTLARGNNPQNICSGTVTLNSGSSLVSSNDVIVQFAGGGHGKLAVNGGTLTIGPAATKWLMVGYYDTGSAEIDITSGQVKLDYGSSLKLCRSGNTGGNVINQTGGSVTFYANAGVIVGGTGNLDLNYAGGSGSSSIYNLSGGTLTVPQIVASSTSGSGTFNFSGGTLKPTASSTAFLTGATAANILAGGAVIDSTNFSITIAQPLLNGDGLGGGLTKLGSGTLTLAGGCTFTGPTTISNGTLALSGGGSISNSANIVLVGGAALNVSAATNSFTVGTAQTLSGNGTVNGPVSINGTLAPGSGAAMGVLTFNSAPALNGVTLLKINRNGGAFTNDEIVLPSAAASFGGTLVVTNVGAPLQAGDTFQLFNAPGYSGAFASVNPPAPGVGLVWSNSLMVNGALTVASAVSLTPTNLTWSVSGTNLTLSWPADHIGWRLESQANALGTNWVAVTGSAGTNLMNLPINTGSAASVYYRLVFP